MFVGVDQDQLSQEFQFLFDGNGPLSAVFGPYYLGESITSHQEAYADDFLTLGALPLTFLRTVDDDLDTDSYAAFGQASWQFNDRLAGTLGLRYTHESKDYFRTTSTFSNLRGAERHVRVPGRRQLGCIHAELRAGLQAD